MNIPSIWKRLYYDQVNDRETVLKKRLKSAEIMHKGKIAIYFCNILGISSSFAVFAHNTNAPWA